MTDYGLRLGPLRFITALEDIQETLGDQFEQIGASITAGDRRPRPFNLTLPVMASRSEADPYAKGLELRRQVRELMENAGWRAQGLPFWWEADPDSAMWLLIGGADLAEVDSGLTFGEFKLTLSDCFIAGRPGTHRQGRRLDLGDRRTGLVSRDTFGLIYSTDYPSIPVPNSPVTLPSGSVRAAGMGGIFVLLKDGPYLDRWNNSSQGVPVSRHAPAKPGETISFSHIDGSFTNDPSPWFGDEPAEWMALSPTIGEVRVWEVENTPATLTKAGDLDPDKHYGWRRVLGPRTQPGLPLTIDNGVCRIRYLGTGVDKGVILQRWFGAGYVDVVRLGSLTTHVLPSFPGEFAPPEFVPIEITPERAVIELFNAAVSMRIVLQRGWTGPRIEARGREADVVVELASALPGGTQDDAAPSWIKEIKVGSTRQALVAQSHAAIETSTTGFNLISQGLIKWRVPASSSSSALALQFSLGRATGDWKSLSAADLASLSLVDARSVPVLVER